jgi:hypothetical protein
MTHTQYVATYVRARQVASESQLCADMDGLPVPSTGSNIEIICVTTAGVIGLKERKQEKGGMI